MKRALSLLLLIVMLFQVFALTACNKKSKNKSCEHTWNKGSLMNAEVCGQGAKIKYTCTKCNETKEQSAENHSYTLKNTISPTCVSKGYSVYTCTYCNHEENREYTDQLGHDCGDIVEVKNATCTGVGYTEYSCTRCSERVVSDFVEAHGHDYVIDNVVTAATCTTKGVGEKTCTRCQDSYEYEINATGHTSTLVSVVEPTCTEDGYSNYACSDCGYEYIDDLTRRLGHQCDVVSEVKNASCTGVGYTEYSCIRCSETIITDFAEAHGHEYVVDTVVTEATCTENGLGERSCTHCDDSYEYKINAIGHSYILVSEDESSATYSCEHCSDTKVIGDEDTADESVKNTQLFDVEPTFTFEIISFSDEEYIRENLKIIDNYYYGSEYENDPDYAIEYILSNIGDNLWTVTATSSYEYSATYVVSLTGDIAFAECSGNELTFTVMADPESESVYEYHDGIVFLQALENMNPGYYPYSVVVSENDNNIYVIVGKINGLEKGMIICAGEVTCAEEITIGKECYFGKIEDFYALADGTWMIVLTEPDISEIFDELSISYSGSIDFSNVVIDDTQVEEALVESLYSSEDFINFLSITKLSAKKYLTNRGYNVEDVENFNSFLDMIDLKPKFERDGSILKATLDGSINIPIKIGSGEEIGKFIVSFTVGVSSKFDLNVIYDKENPTKLDYDIRITQTDTFSFNFNASLEMHKSFLEEDPYVQNTETGKIHRLGCVHLSSITDNSKLKGLSAETAESYIKNNPNLGCKHCQPIVGFKSDLVVLNTNSKVIHAYGCNTLTSIADANKKLSKENATYWIAQGYSCCQLCHPDAREDYDYKAIYANTLYYSDWQEVATNLSQMAKDADVSGYNEKGVTIVKFDYPLPVVTVVAVSVEIRLVLTLDIEATFEYEYKYEHVNAYGMRLTLGGVKPYSENVSSGVISNHYSVIGEIEVKAGLLVDLNINILGLSKYARAGITAEIGAYARIAGVISWSATTDENYKAGFFEAGIYLDVDIYYKLVIFDGEQNLAEIKFALITIGYERAYYGYEKYYDTLVINSSYDIAKSDLLKVKYFDLKTMTTKTDKLLLTTNNKYEVNLSFADGSYCYIENGIIQTYSNAPEIFTDMLIITVDSKTNWVNYKRGNYAFYLGTYEIELEFDNTDSKGLEFTLNDDGESYSVTGMGTCTDANLVIPETYRNLPVTGVGYRAFYQNTTIVTLTLPDNMKVLDNGAFQECHSLLSIKIGSDLQSIDNFSFFNCSSLFVIYVSDKNLSFKSYEGNLLSKDGHRFVLYAIGKTSKEFTIPNGVSVVCSDAFAHSRYLKTVTIPDCVTNIESYAFWHCTSLETVNLSKNITALNKSTFRGCTSLKNVTIPNGVTTIADYVFSECSSIKSLIIPDSVTSIGAFCWDCTSLESITIPSAVTSIAQNTFKNCTSLTSINYGGSISQWGAIFKEVGWDADLGGCKVYCTDVVISIA